MRRRQREIMEKTTFVRFRRLRNGYIREKFDVDFPSQTSNSGMVVYLENYCVGYEVNLLFLSAGE